MRHGAFLCGVVLILAFSAGAQVHSGSSLVLGWPMPAFGITAPAATPQPIALALAAPESAPEPAPEPAAEPEPQGVYGVVQNYDWQAYVGFSHLVFYELPGVTGNLNGFNMSLVFYPHGGHFGADGEFAAEFAPQGNVNTRMEIGLGGARYRLEGPSGLEIWVHGMVGGAHFLPQTAFGGTGAFAFAAGGGIDYTPRRRRLGFRGQVDMVGTRFFGTHQYNPKFSVGIVYRF
jgi:hypothetical protein